MEVLKADALSVRLHGDIILHNISFVIRKGEQWAIVGPSGSGKTTLLKSLIGRQSFTGHLSFPEINPVIGKKMILVDQQHQFKNLSNTSNFYYQQRFNSQ